MGIPVARIELVDRGTCARRFNAYSKLDLKEAPDLVPGVPRHAWPMRANRWKVSAKLPHESWRRRRSIGQTKEEDRQKLWQARHDAFWAHAGDAPGKQDVFATDVCVPISRLARMRDGNPGRLGGNGLYGPIIGPCGRRQFPCGAVLRSVQMMPEVSRVKGFYERLIHRAIAHGRHLHRRTRGGERQDQISRGRAWAGLDVMREIKQALDPKNIMNPGKILPSN